MTFDALATQIEAPRASLTFPDIKKFADISIDYNSPTIPFPNGVYLRENHLITLSKIAQNGSKVEIIGGDGDGKSTMTKELDRYNCDQGRQVFKIDISEQRVRGFIPADEYFGAYMTQIREEVKPLFIIDSADELWYKEGGIKGKSIDELNIDARLGRLTAVEVREFSVMKQKSEYIDWLIHNKDKIDIIFSAHDDDTPNARYTDYSLRRKFQIGLNPYISRMLYTQYSEEDAALLLRHFGIHNSDLIGIISRVAERQHRYLKTLACMKLSGLSISEATGVKGDEHITPLLISSHERAMRSWLKIAEERKLIG